MANEIIDACCLINLFASGKVESILQCWRDSHFVSQQVLQESLTIRQPDPDDQSALVSVPVDPTELMESGLLELCEFEASPETQLFVQFATLIDDGEASCLAIAKSRGWTVATDDRKAIRLANESGIDVVTTPELLQQWVKVAAPPNDDISNVIKNIERFARFRLGGNSEHFEWWSRYKSDS